MVSTQDIAKHFVDAKGNRVKAVDGVSFEASPGKIFGLLGCNGAGKTTTLRILSTVIKPTAGRATVAGYDVVDHPEKVRASIGFMSTSTALYGRLQAKEVIEYFGQLFGLEGQRLKERVAYVMDKLQIHEFGDRLCDKLSTGQKQRVNIARTILHDPPVLFFDEPTAGLDVVVSQTVMEFIEEARDMGKTIIFSTHIMSEAERLCDQISVIHEGTIRGSGTVQQLKEQTREVTLEKAFLKLVEFESSYQREAEVTA
ncbi:MAG: ABC transporter ATP-binding protein [Armatimonadetes bacterium 55-13]|nr:ATP-binding cassette domain-containing protein [Armatimonadota bacterium]OJU62435.1 MAG: ABC transporter ATP-binding protein [Armatimonadetes bacterium 55-13]